MGQDKYGSQRAAYNTNKKKIMASESFCAICGKPVDKTLKFPDPMSPCIDHKFPWSRGGDCSVDNLQLTHLYCNRQKSDKIIDGKSKETIKNIGNNDLPLSADWALF